MQSPECKYAIGRLPTDGPLLSGPFIFSSGLWTTREFLRLETKIDRGKIDSGNMHERLVTDNLLSKSGLLK